METSSLVPPKAGGRSRYSKALPEPPPSFDSFKDLVLPVRKDSLPSAGPPLPPKDTTVRLRQSSDVASQLTESPLLSPLPGLRRINSPPTAVPKRKPVGSGSSVKSPPSLHPIRGDDMSPVESLYSQPITPGRRTFSVTRSPGNITSPKDPFMETPTPKVLRKDIPGAYPATPVLEPSSYLSSPMSSKMERDGSQPQPGAVQGGGRGSRRRPPPPQAYDSQQSPTTPNNSKALPSVPGDLMSTSPKSQASQSPPSYGQLWRRRSVKSDKNLSVSELKLASSHGSTATSSQRSASSPAQESSFSNPLPTFSGLDQDSPILKDSNSAPGQAIRPSASNQSLPRNNPPAKFQSHKTPQDDHELDGFSQYAQEVENGFANNYNDYNNKTAPDNPSTPTRSPEIRRLPTPEYEEDEDRDYVASAPASADATVMLSPASPIFPITPPSDGRPLSMIPEDFVKDTRNSVNKAAAASAAASASASVAGAATAAAIAAYPPPSGPLPALPPRTSSRLSPSSPAAAAAAAPPPRRPVSAGRSAAPVAASAAYGSRAQGGSALASSPLEISEYGASWASSPPTATTNNSNNSNNNNSDSDHYHAPAEQDPIPHSVDGDDEIPPDHHYAPTPGYSRVFLPGDTIPAPPLGDTQLDCFGGHAVLTPSRNESHPVGCMACLVQDRAARFTCSHCSARVCAACRDGLLANGRDLRGLVRALRG